MGNQVMLQKPLTKIIDAGREIERLLQFGLQRGMIGCMDVNVIRNQFLDLFNLSEPYLGELPEEILETAGEILNKLVIYAADHHMFKIENIAHRVLFETRLMGLLMPRASEVTQRFYDYYHQVSPQKATDYLYRLSVDSNYIRMSEIRNNISWQTQTDYGTLEITINLAKPEKDPWQIAQERFKQSDRYPKCLLCPENAGYAGRSDYPARQTLRMVPVSINGETWYLQYSPYVYYNEHCIILSQKHQPIKIDRQTFTGILDFIKYFPHNFCGSNADLPIVGGSILSHNHYQGGVHTFPIHQAKVIRQFKHTQFPDIGISLIKWPLSTIRLASYSPSQLADFAGHIFQHWLNYCDPAVDIQSAGFDQDKQIEVQHNTISPIARINPDGLYEMDLVLRNNRTDDRYPSGIFHPHPEIHHIKKENIGLIEVMGLAILPGRLQKELSAIKSILVGEHPSALVDGPENMLSKHRDWIIELTGRYGTSCAPEIADKILKDAVGNRYMLGLEHAGVFKQTDSGLSAFSCFMNTAGCH